MNVNSVAQTFEMQRAHLRGVAYRMLGSLPEADDAVQETWLRLQRSEVMEIDDLRAWLTTVVSRVCLDHLRVRKSRGEDELDTQEPEPRPPAGEEEALLADSVGIALMVVLDALDPAERLAFVLHDLFGMSFDDIAPIVGRSSVAARQLASRARRRVQGAGDPESEVVAQRESVAAFLAALRGADVAALVAVLDPDVTLQGSIMPTPIRGAQATASTAIKLSKGAKASRVVLIDGRPGILVAPAGRLLLVLRFGFHEARVTSVEVISERARLAALEFSLVD